MVPIDALKGKARNRHFGGRLTGGMLGIFQRNCSDSKFHFDFITHINISVLYQTARYCKSIAMVIASDYNCFLGWIGRQEFGGR